jgi:hypothetical protein
MAYAIGTLLDNIFFLKLSLVQSLLAPFSIIPPKPEIILRFGLPVFLFTKNLYLKSSTAYTFA